MRSIYHTGHEPTSPGPIVLEVSSAFDELCDTGLQGVERGKEGWAHQSRECHRARYEVLR